MSCVAFGCLLLLFVQLQRLRRHLEQMPCTSHISLENARKIGVLSVAVRISPAFDGGEGGRGGRWWRGRWRGVCRRARVRGALVRRTRSCVLYHSMPSFWRSNLKVHSPMPMPKASLRRLKSVRRRPALRSAAAVASLISSGVSR